MAECTNILTMAVISNVIIHTIEIRMKNFSVTVENVIKGFKKYNYLFLILL